MNALSTMLLISDAFVELCDEMPLRKVSISDIVERTGKNRKTFYYHFENKDRLIIWIFRYDMGQCLKQHFSESVLLYDDDPEDPTSRFPYYITQKSGVRSLDHAEFFQCFAEVLEGRRNFYRQALVDNGPYSLRNYLYALYLEAMKRDIDIILSNRYCRRTTSTFWPSSTPAPSSTTTSAAATPAASSPSAVRPAPSPTSSTAPSKTRSRKPRCGGICSSPEHPRRRAALPQSLP